MTNQQILEKAIQKAIDGGWDSFGTETHQIDVEVVSYIDGELQPSGVDVDKPGTYICLYRPHATYSVPELIFNHDFAKALWGEDERKPEKYEGSEFLTTVFKRDWRYHLKEMVIAEDPIAYLGANMRGEGDAGDS